MLENLVVRVEGHAMTWLSQRAASRAETMLRMLLVEAAALWASQGFRRFANDEICCTVCYFDCCEEVVACSPANFPVFRVVYGGMQPTQAMRAGLEHPKTVPIPDLSVLIGQVTIRLEAKRLGISGGLARKYVAQGMRRFFDGRYSSSHGRPGVMLGYAQSDDPDVLIAAVNAQIAGDGDLTSGDFLGNVVQPISVLSLAESSHAEGLRLLHLVFDMR